MGVKTSRHESCGNGWTYRMLLQSCAFFVFFNMDFHVIHFDYDNQITAVNSSKVKCVENTLKPGGRCTVPFETENLTEDGRTAREQRYLI